MTKEKTDNDLEGERISKMSASELLDYVLERINKMSESELLDHVLERPEHLCDSRYFAFRTTIYKRHDELVKARCAS